MTNIQPGWYKDPNGTQQNRWWDGNAWTEHLSEPYSGGVAATTPDVPTSTPFIWIFAVLSVLAILEVAVMNPRQYIENSLHPDVSNPFGIFTLGYFAALAIGFLSYVAWVVFALIDFRTLASRGLQRPFHWAWTFLSPWVYIIGRTVVVGRRTGRRNIGPLVLFIVIYVVATIVTLAVFVDAVSHSMSLLTTP